MANPLYGQFVNQNNNMTNIIKQAQEFRNNYKGNAKEEVQKMLNDGRMSQADFNRLMPIAQQIAAMMPRR